MTALQQAIAGCESRVLKRDRISSAFAKSPSDNCC